MDYTLTLTGIAFANILGAVSPGPAFFFLVARGAANHSRGNGFAIGMGVTAAATLWATAATFGVGVLMTRLPSIYGTIQFIGGIYLIWLGLMSWRRSLTGSEIALANSPNLLSRAALSGFSLSLTNPKIVIFYSSIFVALFPVHTPLWVRLAALGIVAATEALWHALVACVLSHTKVQAGYRRIKDRIDGLMGAVFIGLGARIIALAHI